MPPISKNFEPSAAPPNTFLQSLTGQRGLQLSKFVDTLIPVYEQERYERRLIQLSLTKIGTGAGGSFQFNPPAAVGSFLVKQVFVLGELTAVNRWSLDHVKILDDGTPSTVQKATIAVLAGNQIGVLVQGGGSSAVNSIAGSTVDVVSAEFTCWRNIRNAQDQGEFFQVNINLITVAQPVFVFCDLEIVPPAASVVDMSSLATVT